MIQPLPFGAAGDAQVTPAGYDYNPRLRSKIGHLKQRFVRELDERMAAFDAACSICSSRSLPHEIGTGGTPGTSPLAHGDTPAARAEISDADYAASPESFDLEGSR
jgi:hypothetical protein